MAKTVKVEIIYYKCTNDVTLEFGLHGDFPCRLLSHTCDDLESFFRAFKRAIQRSEIIITAGGLTGNEYLPGFIAKTIGKKTYLPDYTKEGIDPARPYPLPEGAIPIACRSGKFGGYLIECGPQAIFGLCDDRKCRREFAETVIKRYINEYCSVYSAGDIVSYASTLNNTEKADQQAEDSENTEINEIPMTAVVLSGAESTAVAKAPFIPESQEKEAEKETRNDLNEETLYAESITASETANKEYPDTIKDSDCIHNISPDPEKQPAFLTPEDLDLDLDETELKLYPRFRYSRIFCIVFIVLILFSILALLYFYKDGDNTAETLNSNVSDISSYSSSSGITSQHIDVIIGQNDSDVEFTDRETASGNEYEQTEYENESNVRIEIIVSSDSSGKTNSRQNDSSAVSSKANSSYLNTSAEPSSTSETNSQSKTSTTSESTAASSSKESSSTESTAVASFIKTDNPLYLWDVTLTVTNNGNVISGSAADIVARSVEAELGDRYPEEALKAQAITCYSWLLFHGAASGKAPSVPLKTASQKSIDAVNAVKGQLCVYDGAVAETVYSAYSAGYSAAYQNIWQWKSNWQATTHVPYLQSVECKVDETLSNFMTTTTYSADEVKKLIKEKYDIDVSNMDKEKWIVPTMYDENDLYCIRVSIGGKDCAGPELRNTLFGLYSRTNNPNGLKSSAYRVTYDSEKDTFTVVCKGWGHGVGMSQEAAAIYAKQGWDYEKIVKHFFLGIEIMKFVKE